MLEAFANGFFAVLSWPTFGYLLLGVAIGFAVGILPGLGGAVALAMMLPFTFNMQPVEAFAFLLGMLSVLGTTGDITSVLFGVPGEAVGAATVVDGHPLAKMGQAGRALGANLSSSLIGALVGAFALAAMIPIVRPLVLSFGSPEFFMLILLGITFIASLTGAHVHRGVMSGALGLMIATVGLEPHLGTPRYTFGELHFWAGVGIIPVTIGLFAVPELYDLAIRRTSIAKEQPGRLGGVMEGVKDSLRHWKLVIRCSLIGTFAGVIPGLGGGIAQWLAYAHAVQSSPNKERFGHGAIEGVLAPGAANNSVAGGQLVPTVAFGVPGSVGMAVLLGAFLIQGLVPGPAMLTTHLDLVMSFVWTIVFGNIIAVTGSFIFLQYIARITFVRGTLLIPVILLLISVGAFAANNSMLDVLVMLLFGVLGLAMARLAWPRPPLVLGLVLGGLAENYLFRSVDVYGLAWLTRPGVIVLGLLCLMSVLFPLIQSRWHRRVTSVADLQTEIASDETRTA